MNKINNPIVFTKDSLNLILRKKSCKNFSHLNWNDDDLLPLRKEIREHYRKVQKLTCAYCQNQISSTSVGGCHIEHIVPKALYVNFIFTPKNICLICPDCNQSKGKNDVVNLDPLLRKKISTYPRSSNAFKIVHPHFDEYSDHIIKFERIYIDKTPKGHWTIGVCKLNRFFHLFGMCDELIEDAMLVEERDCFSK